MTRLILLCLLLASCGGSRVATDAVPAPRVTFGDRDPVDWGGRGPDAYPIHGVDLSRWQGQLDWAAARRAGTSFAWIKATEGADRVDPMFAVNHDAAKSAGVAIGAYHFFYWCSSAENQAAWFIRNVPRRAGDLPPVLDLEWTPFSPTCTVRPPAGEVRDRARRFLDIVERHYGQRPVIYTTREFYRETGIGQLGTDLWLRATAEPVTDVYPGARWTVWQYSATGRVDGIAGDVDLNVFNGRTGDWAAWLARRRQ